jgi:hypothetical protein
MITMFKEYEPMKKWIYMIIIVKLPKNFMMKLLIVTILFFWYSSLFLPKI